MSNPTQVAVIGGGISGLACAYRLQQSGVDVALLEASDQPGGLMGTVEKDGVLFESGPQSFQGTETLLDLIRELGIEGELQRADPRAPRYVFLHGHLRKIPMSPQALLTTSLLGARLALENRVGSFQAQQTAERRRIGGEFRPPQIRPRNSGISRGAVCFRRLCGRPRKTQPAGRVSLAG